MAADRTTTADTGTEDLEGSSAPERRPPPDTPGAAGAPSRADSRAAAAAANDQCGPKPGADKPEAAPPTEDPAVERDVVEGESESPATGEVHERSAAAPHEHPAETEPGDVAERGQGLDESAPVVGSTEAAEPAVEDGASAAGHAPEPLNAGENEAVTVEPSDGGEAAGADTADGEADGPGETPPAEIEDPRDAVEVLRKPRRDIPDEEPEDDKPAEEPVEVAVPVRKDQDKTTSSSGASSSAARRASAAESSESSWAVGADQREDTGHGTTDAGSPTADTAPAIGDDGAWEWKGLRLDPEANHIADIAYTERRIAEGRDEAGNYAEHGITPAMRRIADELDHGELVGCPEFSLKTEERFKEKLAKKIGESPGLPAREVAGRIHDGIRYTFTFDPQRYTAAVEDTRRRLEEAGYSLEFQRPTWGDPDYKGVNSRWRDPASGQLFEVQFHTPQSWDAKQTTHDAYEKMAAPTTPPEEVARLQAYQREVTASVEIPPGALEIPYYEKEY